MHSEEITCPHCGVPFYQSNRQKRKEPEICPICKKSVHYLDQFYPVRFVTIYVPNNESERMAAQAILKSANIQFFCKNFTVQNLFGAGQIGTGFNIVTGPIQIQVPEEDAEEARELLNDYFSGWQAECDAPETDWQERRHLAFQQNVNNMINWAIIFSVFWLGGIGPTVGIYFSLKALQMIDDSTERIKGKWRGLFALVLSSIGVVSTPYLWIRILNELQVL